MILDIGVILNVYMLQYILTYRPLPPQRPPEASKRPRWEPLVYEFIFLKLVINLITSWFVWMNTVWPKEIETNLKIT